MKAKTGKNHKKDTGIMKPVTATPSIKAKRTQKDKRVEKKRKTQVAATKNAMPGSEIVRTALATGTIM